MAKEKRNKKLSATDALQLEGLDETEWAALCLTYLLTSLQPKLEDGPTYEVAYGFLTDPELSPEAAEYYGEMLRGMVLAPAPDDGRMH